MWNLYFVLQDITASMDDGGLQKVNMVCDLAEKILPNTSSEGKRSIEQQVTELTNEWEKLNLAIPECSTMLEGVQDRYNDYEKYYGSLVKWLADMENVLMPAPDPKAQLVEKKTQLDKYKVRFNGLSLLNRCSLWHVYFVIITLSNGLNVTYFLLWQLLFELEKAFYGLATQYISVSQTHTCFALIVESVTVIKCHMR